MNYSLQQIANIVNGTCNTNSSKIITQVATDSRSLYLNSATLFFCLVGERFDAHHYIQQCIDKGIDTFVVSNTSVITQYNNINFILVDNTLVALQQLAIYHRQQFNFPVIGITGSNGKTIVKEWLFQLLNEDFSIVKSPKSYNSQIGVALSVLQMNEQHNLAIFEAGISTTNEMQQLQKMIEPTLGIFTNIGEAHNAGFKNQAEKTKEKLILFNNTDEIIYNNKYTIINELVKLDSRYKSIGFDDNAYFKIKNITKENQSTQLIINDNLFVIPFIDDASIENALHCICMLLILNYDVTSINQRMAKLKKLAMRLSLNYGINQCTIIDDSYSADFSGLQIALDFMHQQATNKNRTLIVSGFEESGLNNDDFIKQLIHIIQPYHIQKIITIGNVFDSFQEVLQTNFKQYLYFENTNSFIKQFYQLDFHNEIILIKGARKYQFEYISQLLIGKTHETILEINLNSLINNFNAYKKLLSNHTGIIAMVKAFSYGSGSVEIASVLQSLKASYLAVAYADEGVHLRNNGITIPIMVMNPAAIDFNRMIEYHLEPVIYDDFILQQLINQLSYYNIDSLNIHIKVETGMNRLGFTKAEIPSLLTTLQAHHHLKIATIFSHLAASEDDNENQFSNKQIEEFKIIFEQIQNTKNYPIKKHILNSSGIVNFPQAHFDFVRLGIGLYGIDTSNKIQVDLESIGTLKTRITQIKKVKQGDTIGYSRKGKATQDMTIAILAIGYADGFDRRFSNGVGEVYIKQQKAKIIGNVCMDMTMIDISNISDVNEGDEVEIFGSHIAIKEQAQKIGTIGYELLTGISSRVKRVYYLD
ncbi:MAG: bifunctional UDP-N-acetylmuramoyl-tripeptide:D-alanyl-D-alanine ligase/alanine racemase [Chitinophagales bacterium]|nr:bifunctional UDP-N-acetylmuramoyl-tripeptide:D-alanyl-D-alanine ligase/alanine racemase [Chitinophagales bacterium]